MSRFLPLLIFLALAGILFASLGVNSSLVPSPLINKPAPHFKLPKLLTPQLSAPSAATPEDMKGRMWLLNVWASWCVSCRIEHHYLLELQKRDVNIVGLNYKDKESDAQTWLLERGDPYLFSVVDADGAAALDWGVYGVPETFIIDKNGIIKYKHIGPIDAQTLEKIIMPFIDNLQKRAL